MSFSGKKYKRTKHEHLEAILKSPHTSKQTLELMKRVPPIFCFTKVGENAFNYVLETDDNKHYSFNFTLGEEIELERRNGEKMTFVFSMPNENALNQVVKFRDGKVFNFYRFFNGNEARMIVNMNSLDKQTIVYFESVN